MRWVRWVGAGFLLAWSVGTLGAQINMGAPGTATAAQTSGATTASSSIVAPYSVRGKVVNGLDGSGIPRALVSLVSRRMLTDAQGNFEFDGFTLLNGSLTAQKPGFGATPDGMPMGRVPASPDLTAPVVLKLYPNAVLTGVVTGRDGLPVERARVQLAGAVFDTTGMRWVQSASAVTDMHGEYRFNPLPGRYRVTVAFLARGFSTGETVLPVSFPEITSSDKSNFIVLSSGQQRQVDLQTRTGISYPIDVNVEPANAQNVRFTVTTTAGDSFVSPSQLGQEGVFRLALPTGTYQVRAHVDEQEISEEGVTRVTVTGRPAAPATLQLAPLTSLPVELAMDPAAASSSATNSITNQTPNVAQFNLRLKNEKNVGAGVDGDVVLTLARNQPAAFRVPPGRYRLTGAQNGTWHVESATMGQVNLLSGEVVIGPSVAGTPIRIVVDNRTGMLQGTVRLPDSVSTAWVYLIAVASSLSVVSPVVTSPAGTSSSAAFSVRAPIGSYHVLALDHQLHTDLRDPDLVKGFSTAVQMVDITADATATVQLDLAREKGGSR